MWTYAPEIKPFFSDITHIPKLLTENRIVVKEINAASKINPAFTLQFCLDLFKLFWDKKMNGEFEKGLCPFNWVYAVGYQHRHVMDFYTVARIIKLRMKHVIFYAGDLHLQYVAYILLALDFKLNKKDIKNNDCFTPDVNRQKHNFTF